MKSSSLMSRSSHDFSCVGSSYKGALPTIRQVQRRQSRNWHETIIMSQIWNFAIDLHMCIESELLRLLAQGGNLAIKPWSIIQKASLLIIALFTTSKLQRSSKRNEFIRHSPAHGVDLSLRHWLTLNCSSKSSTAIPAHSQPVHKFLVSSCYRMQGQRKVRRRKQRQLIMENRQLRAKKIEGFTLTRATPRCPHAMHLVDLGLPLVTDIFIGIIVGAYGVPTDLKSRMAANH